MLPGYTKRCDGEGCKNVISVMQPLCDVCARKAKQEEAALSLYANEGFKALLAYLERWAEFEALYGPN